MSHDHKKLQEDHAELQDQHESLKVEHDKTVKAASEANSAYALSGSEITALLNQLTIYGQNNNQDGIMDVIAKIKAQINNAGAAAGAAMAPDPDAKKVPNPADGTAGGEPPHEPTTNGTTHVTGAFDNHATKQNPDRNLDTVEKGAVAHDTDPVKGQKIGEDLNVDGTDNKDRHAPERLNKTDGAAKTKDAEGHADHKSDTKSTKGHPHK